MMGSLISILTALAPVLSQISGLVTKAVAANATGDQAALDKLHAEARGLADGLRPGGV